MVEQKSNSLLENNPPQNIEAEKAFIASLLIDREAILKVADQIKVDYFYYDSHKAIVQSILDHYEKDEPVDLVTLNNSLKDNDDFQKVGGATYLAEITDFVPTSANTEYYLKIIKNKSELRTLINVCTEILQEAFQAKEDFQELIDKAEGKIFEIAKERISSDLVPLKPILSETVDLIEKRYHSKDAFSGIPSGFSDLDKLTGGFQRSDLIIIAARPSMGKTAFCLNIAENACLKYKGSVAFFSLEMSKQQLCQRFISSYARIDSQRIRTGKIEQSDFLSITSAMSQISSVKLFLDDTPAISALEIRAKARRLKAKESIDLIIIDYLQLIAPSASRKNDNRQNEIAEISRSLKALARELEVPVIALSQLSRSVELRGDKRPILSDLRESGAIEQDADVVTFIYREEYYHPDNEDAKGKGEIIIAKQRNGPTGTVSLSFNPAFTRFDNLAQYQ